MISKNPFSSACCDRSRSNAEHKHGFPGNTVNSHVYPTLGQPSTLRKSSRIIAANSSAVLVSFC